MIMGEQPKECKDKEVLSWDSKGFQGQLQMVLEIQYEMGEVEGRKTELDRESEVAYQVMMEVGDENL